MTMPAREALAWRGGGRSSPGPSLRYRAPLPPPVFVGREAELSALARSIETGPVSVVWGLGGVGKTALVLRTLQRYFPDRGAHVVFIGLRPGDPSEQAPVEAVRALAELAGVPRVDWAGLIGNADRAMTAAIALAEQTGAWVVMDDLHHGDPSVTRALLAKARREARTARWIGTDREDPCLPDLAGHVLPLRAMPDEDLERLARHYVPSLGADELARAVAVAAGSPWRLCQHLAGNDVSVDADLAGALRGMPLAARLLVDMLAVVELPLPPMAVAQLGPELPGDVLKALERRGVVERSAAGYRLHDMARALVVAKPRRTNDEALRARVAEVLASGDGASSALESLRLHLEAGRIDAAIELLERRSGELLVAPEALRLWNVLARFDHERLARWRLRCALTLGTQAPLAAVRCPADPSASDLVAWARRMQAVGRFEDCERVAIEAEVAAMEAGDRASSFDAGLVHGLSLAARGRLEEAVIVFESLTPPDAGASIRRDVLVARGLAILGRHEEALALARRVAAGRAAVGEEMRPEIDAHLAQAYALTGRLLEATAVLDPAPDPEQRPGVTACALQRELVFRTMLALDAARLREAERMIVALERAALCDAYSQLTADVLEVLRRLLVGELGGLSNRVAALMQIAAGRGDAYSYERAALAWLELAALRADGSTEPPWPTAVPPPRGPVAALLRLARRRRVLLAGGPPEALSDTEDARDDIPVHVWATARWVGAHADLLDGDVDGALAKASEAADRAREHGWRIIEIEALSLKGELFLVADRDEEARATADEMAKLAGEIGSRRFASDATLLASLAAGRFDPDVLEPLADLESVAPMTARRARSLLGGDVALDVRDQRLLAAVARRRAGRG